MTKYLSDLEISKIKSFNEDEVLKNALRKVFLSPLYNQGVLSPKGELDETNPTQNFALTSAFHMLLQKREMWDLEKLGAINLANAMAIQMVEQGFGECEKYQNTPKKGEESEEVDPR